MNILGSSNNNKTSYSVELGYDSGLMVILDGSNHSEEEIENQVRKLLNRTTDVRTIGENAFLIDNNNRTILKLSNISKYIKKQIARLSTNEDALSKIIESVIN